MIGHCPACLSGETSEAIVSVRKDYSLPGYAYRKCAACGSLYLDDPKVASQAQLTAFHAAHWYDAGNFQFSRDKTGAERRNAAVAGAEAIITALGLEPGARILDIGCGRGDLVAAFGGLGHDAWGIEPDAKAIDGAANVIHLSLEALVAGEQGPPPALKARFDLVILRDVLEHLFDPAQTLTAIRRSIAAPGGRIYIEVPSGESLQLRLMREYAWSFMAPFHRTLFTRQGLRDLAARCGAGEVDFLADRRKNWGWTRGAAYRSGFAAGHEALRASEPGFRDYDYALDDMLDELSFTLDAPPSITAVVRAGPPPGNPPDA